MELRRLGRVRVSVIHIKAEFRALALLLLVGGLVSWVWVEAGFRPWQVLAGGDGAFIVKHAHVDAADAAIALTFDDGPNPTFTPQVLALLARYQAKATFFVSGVQAEKWPALLQAIAAGGHQMGNHCYRHINFTKLPLDQFLADVAKADSIIESATGQRPTVYRPPLGRYNRPMLAAMAAQGRRAILWSYTANSNDSWLSPTAGYIIERVIKGVRPGSIVLLHDHGGNRTNTVVALGEILPILRARGYRFVTVSELLALER